MLIKNRIKKAKYIRYHINPEQYIEKTKTKNPYIIDRIYNCFGCIQDRTGITLINVEEIYKDNPNTFINNVVQTISHEIMHHILDINEDNNTSLAWDYIAESLGELGYLGGL